MPNPIKAAQLADHIRDALANWLSRDLPGTFITINQVTLNPSLSKATAWISNPLPHQHQLLETKIKKNTGRYGRALARYLSRKRALELEFKWDTPESDLFSDASASKHTAEKEK